MFNLHDTVKIKNEPDKLGKIINITDDKYTVLVDDEECVYLSDELEEFDDDSENNLDESEDKSEDKSNEEIVDEDSNEDSSDDIENDKHNSKKKWINIALVFLVILTIAFTAYNIIRHKRMTLSTSHIYVGEKNNDSEFDKWITDEVKVDWVPTFLVIKDNKILGFIRGPRNSREFKSDLGTVLINNIGIDVADLPITNLDGETKSFADIVANNDLTFVEIARIDCLDCEEQLKFNPQIYLRYNSSNFYIYYIHSDKQEVMNKHK